MALYRDLVFFATLKVPTILVLLPIFLPVEVASWLLSIKGGWVKGKGWSALQWFRFSTWKSLIRMKRRAHRLRRIPDHKMLQLMTAKIADQEQLSPIIRRIGNPVMGFLWKHLFKLIRW